MITQKPASDAKRYVFIDGLRGIAALMVLFLHLSFILSSSSGDYGLEKILPQSIMKLLHNGHSGVEVFFVISGFVMMYSLRSARITPGFLGRFALRRSLRLDPPYWVALAAVLFIQHLTKIQLTALTIPGSDDVTSRSVLLNAVYLHTIVGETMLLDVSWTLCLEVQFYLVLVLLLACVQQIMRWSGLGRKLSLVIVFAPLLVLSLWMSLPVLPALRSNGAWGVLSSHGIFFSWWYMFFAGSLVCLVLQKELPDWTLLVFCLLTLPLFLSDNRVHDKAPLVIPVTAGIIFFVGKAGKFGIWLGGAVAQYFGRLSYSLYLVHLPAMLLVTTLVRPWLGISAGRTVFYALLAVASAIAAADLLQRSVESFSIRLAHRVNLKPVRVPAPVPEVVVEPPEAALAGAEK